LCRGMLLMASSTSMKNRSLISYGFSSVGAWTLTIVMLNFLVRILNVHNRIFIRKKSMTWWFTRRCMRKPTPNSPSFGWPQ
jgi:hypothetical protein